MACYGLSAEEVLNGLLIFAQLPCFFLSYLGWNIPCFMVRTLFLPYHLLHDGEMVGRGGCNVGEWPGLVGLSPPVLVVP